MQDRDYTQFKVDTESSTLFTDLKAQVQLFDSLDCNDTQEVITDLYIYKLISSFIDIDDANSVENPLRFYAEFFNICIIKIYVEQLSDAKYIKLLRKCNV